MALRRAAGIAACAALIAAAPAGAASQSSPVLVAGGGGTQITDSGVAPLSAAMSGALGVAASADALPPNGTIDSGAVYIVSPSANRAYRYSPEAATPLVANFAGNGFGPSDGASYTPFSSSLDDPLARSLAEPANLVWSSAIWTGSATAPGVYVVNTDSDEIGWVEFGTPNKISKLSGFKFQTSPLGDGGAPTYDHPQDLAPSGNGGDYYVADTGHRRIRLVQQSTLTASTVAGDGDSTSAPPPDTPDTPPNATDYDVGAPVTVSSGPGTYDFSFSNGTTVYGVAAGKITRIAGGGGSAPSNGATARNVAFSDVTSVRSIPGTSDLLIDDYDGLSSAVWRLRDGDHTLALVATLPGRGRLSLGHRGVYGTAAGEVFVVPAAAVQNPPPAYTNNASTNFGFASWDSDASFLCTYDYPPPPNPGVLPPPVACDGRGLPDGAHTLPVWAFTAAGESAHLTLTWTVDTVAPNAFDLIAPAPDATATDVRQTFSWNATTDGVQPPVPPNSSSGTPSGIDHYELWIDGAKSGANVTCSASPCSAKPASLLSDGRHTWKVLAVDKAGNSRASEQRTLNVSFPPTAALSIAPARSLTGRAVSFDASGSSDANGPIARYEWDLDGDGSFETDSAGTATTSRVYDSPGTLTISVRVTDADGNTAVASGQLIVTESAGGSTGPLGVSINDGAQYTNNPKVTVTARGPAFANKMLLSNDGGFVQAQTFPVQLKTAWTLDSSGPERLPKIVYVRFSGGSQTSETYTDDIILDETPPKVDKATVAPVAGAAGLRAASLPSWRVKLKASDSNSGVGAIQVTANRRKPGPLIAYKPKLSVRSAKRPQFVRARDRAGNFSPWRKAAKR